MGACMANQQRRGTISSNMLGKEPLMTRFSWQRMRGARSDNNAVTLSKEQSMLLDMWNEKHIQILKKRFAEGITNKKSNCLDYAGFLRVFDHTKREGFEKGISILNQFGATICKQAFKLFDSSKFGAITFKDFCCALSIICLGSSNEKIRFLFDLFDLDRDGVLSKKELVQSLQTLVNILVGELESNKQVNKLRQQWVELQLADISEMCAQESVDYFVFHEWAENNIDVFKVLQPFEIIPSPYREHEIIQQILDSHQRKHGDTFYVLSYRWWDRWKEFTEKHASTQEVQDFVLKVRQNIAQHKQMSDELKSLILGINELEEQRQLGSNIKKSLEKAEWGVQETLPDLGIEEMGLGLSISMRQQMQVQKRRLSATPSNRLLTETPRQQFSVKMSNASMHQDNSKILEETEHDFKRADQYRQKDPVQSRTAAVGFAFPEEFALRQKTINQRLHPKSLTGPPSQVITRSYTMQMQTPPQLEKVESGAESSQEDICVDKDLNLQMQETDQLIKKEHQVKRGSKMGGKLKQLVNPSQSALNKDISQKSIKMDGSSFARQGGIDDSKYVTQLQISGSRPNTIDNSDIEGEHPGQMQPNLIMYRDFVTIPEQAWHLFVLWYGLQEKSPVFPRKVLMHNSVASLELYPPRISCLIADREGKPVSDSQKSLFVSVSLKIEEMHLKICELFNYISTRDTRLWIKQANEWTLVVPELYTVADGDIFLVEVKFYGNQWPMDTSTQQEKRDWRQFEVGDKLDVKAQDTWKVGQIEKVTKDSLKIHLINENWKNDLVIKKDSDLVAQFGTHTLQLHFNKDEVEQNLPEGVAQGIKNIGNTCYMNAVLQALLHAPLYKNYFKTQAFKKFILLNKEEDFVCEAFSKLITQIKQNPGPQLQVLEPLDFKKTINTQLPLFFGNQQQDAAEFYNFMLDKMNEEMNRVDKKKQQPLEPSDNPPTEQAGGEKDAEGLQEDQIEVDTGRLLDKQRVQEETERLKVLQQQQAIKDAKQTVYSEFFQKSLPQIPSSQQRKNSAIQIQKEQDKTQDADSLNPLISAVEAKAKNAWFTAQKLVNSPVSDLFVGQQTTEVTCLKCQNKTHTFENFYSLPVPLPANKKSTFYVHLVRQQRKSKVIQPVIAYGIQINKYLKLSDLIQELQKQTNLSDSFSVCELSQQKINRVHEDFDKQILNFILKRTNQLFVYEHQNQIQYQSHRNQSSSSLTNKVRALQTHFTSFDEIQPGMLIDACDSCNKWYVGLVVEKQQQMIQPSAENQSEVAQVVNRVLVHYYQLHQKFDEWYDENPESFKRIKPLGASQLAEQPKDQLIKVILLHRQQSQFIGMPYCLNVANWLTWDQLHKEISYQVMKHIRQVKQVVDQEVSIDDESNCVLPENEQPLLLTNIGSVRRPGKNLISQQQNSPNILNFQHNRGNKRLLEPINQKYVRINTGQAEPSPSSETNIQKPPPSLLKRNTTAQSLLATVPEDSDAFKIKIVEADSHKCVFCLLKQKLSSTESTICQNGCQMPQSNEQIKYTLNMLKQIEIIIDWDGQYQDAPCHFDSSFLRCKKLESELMSGIPLTQCLELYSKKEKIEGYQCDTCHSQENALIKPFISHLPDILVIQLKRFQFEAGYLDKIEDLVTFPIKNLEMQRYLIQGMQTNSTYDLFAVVNHHIYQTGGHYTAATQLEPSIWSLMNDSLVTQVKNPMTDLVNKDAYMLFYKKREFTPSNILKLATHQV